MKTCVWMFLFIHDMVKWTFNKNYMGTLPFKPLLILWECKFSLNYKYSETSTRITLE